SAVRGAARLRKQQQTEGENGRSPICRNRRVLRSASKRRKWRSSEERDSATPQPPFGHLLPMGEGSRATSRLPAVGRRLSRQHQPSPGGRGWREGGQK